MNRIGKYTFLMTIICGLIGCDGEGCPAVSMGASSSEYLQFVEQMLAADETCLPPCWQGLVPGAAIQADVLATLNTIPFVNKEYITQQEVSESEISLINWENTAPQSLTISGQARFDSHNLLTAIQFWANFRHPLQSFGTVIETFGEPDFFSVIPSHDYNCKWDSLIWLEKGLEIHTYPELAGENGPRMHENTAVSSIKYFIPQQTVEGYLRNIIGLSESDMQRWLSGFHEWPGFNETGEGSNE